MLIAAPFYTDSLRGQLPLIVVGAVVLVAIAGLVNPRSMGIFLAAAVASGIGLVVYELWALYWYEDSNAIQFIIREVIAVTFLVGFYFSIKTTRSFMLHRIGKHDEAGEFDNEPAPSIRAERREAPSMTEQFLPLFLQRGKNRDRRSAAPEDSPAQQSPGRSRKDMYPTETPYEEIL